MVYLLEGLRVRQQSHNASRVEFSLHVLRPLQDGASEHLSQAVMEYPSKLVQQLELRLCLHQLEGVEGSDGIMREHSDRQ